LKESHDDSAAVPTQFVEGRNKDPELRAEGGDDKHEWGPTIEEGENEEVGTYQQDGRTGRTFALSHLLRTNSGRQVAQ